MRKIIRIIGISFASVSALALIYLSLKNSSFPHGFYGILIFLGLYRYLTEAKPLNKYNWLLLVTSVLFVNGLLAKKSALDSLIISGATGLLMIGVVAIYDFLVKPLWKKFKPSSAMVSSEDPEEDVGPIYVAASSGNVSALKKMIDEKCKVDAVDKIGATALMYAARNNQIECIRMLLEAGADASLKTKKGYTALWFAENNEHEKAAEIIKAGI